ncbi:MULTISPECIES: ATP-binding protein [unclassified Methylibium]|uniref:ATP-binding protein n=1 Tax=unclassified Methylibium TaxID=2633235 RepID=UPI001E299C9B|nr:MULTISPECIES: ATP-binding protein [unclassified Methylibium]
MLKRAFEPYVTTKTKGTGLGLAVVKKIADEHGARIRLANLAGDAVARGDAPSVGGHKFRYHFRNGCPPGSALRPRRHGMCHAPGPHGDHPCCRRRTRHPRTAVGHPERRGP